MCLQKLILNKEMVKEEIEERSFVTIIEKKKRRW